MTTLTEDRIRTLNDNYYQMAWSAIEDFRRMDDEVNSNMLNGITPRKAYVKYLKDTAKKTNTYFNRITNFVGDDDQINKEIEYINNRIK